MGYVYELLVALLFSFGGTCVKLINPYFTPGMITFMRFFVGCLWLVGLKAVRRQRFRSDFVAMLRRHWGWLLFGAVAKLLAYTTENIALSLGVSYGNILTQPAQMVLLTVLGVTALGERMSPARWAGIGLCVAGILLISWNGMSLQTLMDQNLLLTLLFVVSGVCAGLFVFAQKKLAGDFDILDSNLTMFALAAAMGLCVPAFQGAVLPAALPDAKCVLAILLFGFITGIGFYLNARAMPLVPFRMVAILQSTMVFFTLAWGILFFHESVSGWIVGGTSLFVVGMILMQRRDRPESQ